MSERQKGQRTGSKSGKPSITKTKKANDKKPLESSDKGLTPNLRSLDADKDDKASGGFERLTWVAVALVVVGLAILAYSRGFEIEAENTPLSKSENTKSASKPNIGGPFTLIDQDGKLTTDQDFKGQHMLIYFGYTYCPDICPNSLTTMSDALDLLGEDANKVTPILITFDPARDTPEYLKEYASYFHPRLKALTGTPEQIASVTKAYRVYYAKTIKEDSEPEDYLMNHSSATYLMGPNGAFLLHFSHGTDVEIMARRIREKLF